MPEVDRNRDDRYSSGKMKHLGGYAEAARTLTQHTGRPWTRQNLHQTWKRRQLNGFPCLHAYSINGHIKFLFDMDEITEWAATR